MAKVESAPPPGVDLTEAAAGVQSVRQSLSQEPSFTRKRRVGDGGGESQISRDAVLRQEEEEEEERRAGSRNKANRALSFRAGHRRSQPAPLPSEYQVQYTWKCGQESEAPLLRAAERLRHNEGAGREGGGVSFEKKGKKPKEPQANGHVPVEQQKHNGESHFRKSVSHSKSPEHVKGRRSGHRASRKQRGQGRKKRQTRNTFTDETEYQRQFKAWALPPAASEALPGARRKTVRSPKKRSDITDPRLVTPSPTPAPLPPGPLRFWGTEYSTRFKSPLDFKYIRGAWMESPQPSPTSKRYQQPSPEQPLSVWRANGKEGGGEDEPSDVEEEEEERGIEGERASGEQPIPAQESLLAQLSEIRHKAVEYRQRSEGCHFLPAVSSWQQHPTESKRETTPISAHPSVSSSLSSLSTEEPVGVESGMRPPQYSVSRPLENGGAHLIDVEDEEQGEEEEEEGEGEGKREGTEGSSGSEVGEEEEDSKSARRTPNSPEPKSHRIPAAASGKKPPTPSVPPSGEVEGRIPTPILQQSSDNVLRHHLDRTTPSSGAVLTSPTLPAFVKMSQSKTGSSRSRGAGREFGNTGGSGAAPVSTRSFGGKEKEATMSDIRKKGLHLSQSSAKLKRDPSLISSASARPTPHARTLPQSSLAQHSHVTPAPAPRAPGSCHTLPTSPPRPSPPLSSISSLLSSLRTSYSSNPPNTKLNYTSASARRKAPVGSVQPTLPPSLHCRSSDTGGDTSGKCDICGSWLRKTRPHTSCQVDGLSSWDRHRHQPQATVPLGSSTSRKYRGPVTQLSEKLQTRGVSSHVGERFSSVGLGSNSPRPNGVPNSPPGVRVPQQTNPRPLRAADELSISSLSLSNCSVASDLLKKARERREKFWTQPPSNPAHT